MIHFPGLSLVRPSIIPESELLATVRAVAVVLVVDVAQHFVGVRHVLPPSDERNTSRQLEKCSVAIDATTIREAENVDNPYGSTPRMRHELEKSGSRRRASSCWSLPILFARNRVSGACHPFQPGNFRRFREQVLAFFWPSSLVDVQQLTMVEPPVLTEITSIGSLKSHYAIVVAPFAMPFDPPRHDFGLAVGTGYRCVVWQIAIVDMLTAWTVIVAGTLMRRADHDGAEILVLHHLRAWDWIVVLLKGEGNSRCPILELDLLDRQGVVETDLFPPFLLASWPVVQIITFIRPASE